MTDDDFIDLDDNVIDAEVEHPENLPEVIPDRTPVKLTDLDDVEHQEDYLILTLLQTKIFRRAIVAEAQLDDLPDVHSEVIDALGDLTDTWNDLNDARDGKAEVDWQLSEWKQALSQYS